MSNNKPVKVRTGIANWFANASCWAILLMIIFIIGLCAISVFASSLVIALII